MGADARIETDARVRISRRDPTTGMIAAEEVRHASAAIGRAVRDVLTEERRPLIIGGDCTVLLGVFLGLPRGIGLWFVDGHADFLDGGTSPTGEAAAMDLAILTGHGPPRLLGSAGILVDPTSVALLGHCPDHLSPDVASENARIDPAIRALTAPEIRERGAGRWVRRLRPAISASRPGCIYTFVSAPGGAERKGRHSAPVMLAATYCLDVDPGP